MRATGNEDKKMFEIYFDNGGNATLQTADYCHCYDNGSRLAEDVRQLLADGHTNDWDGNQPECRIDAEAWQAADGEVWNAENVSDLIAGASFRSKGETESDFIAALAPASAEASS